MKLNRIKSYLMRKRFEPTPLSYISAFLTAVLAFTKPLLAIIPLIVFIISLKSKEIKLRIRAREVGKYTLEVKPPKALSWGVTKYAGFMYDRPPQQSYVIYLKDELTGNVLGNFRYTDALSREIFGRVITKRPSEMEREVPFAAQVTRRFLKMLEEGR